MAHKSLVSVIVPVYNVEQYLPRCLDSLIGQTLEEIEIICIDDGSTDQSGRILDEYASRDSRIKVVHQENGGYGKAMNTGLQQANGNYIGVLESDDFAAPQMYQLLYQTAERYQVEVVKSNYYRYWELPKEKTKKEPLLKHLPYGQIIHPWAYQRLFRIQPSIWSGLYRRDFLEQHQITFLETPGAAYQDTFFTFQIFTVAQKIVLLPDGLLYYRQDNANSSIHSASKAFYICQEYQAINQFLQRKASYSPLYKIRNQAMFHTYLWNYVRLEPKFCEPFLYQMQRDFAQLQKNGQLHAADFAKADWQMLHAILEQPVQFLKKESCLMPLRQKISNRGYRALLIGRIAGISTMLQAVITRLRRK